MKKTDESIQQQQKLLWIDVIDHNKANEKKMSSLFIKYDSAHNIQNSEMIEIETESELSEKK